MEMPDDNKKTKAKDKTKKTKEKVEEKTASKMTSDSGNTADEINNFKKEIETLKEKNLRLLADLDNQRKNYLKEISEMLEYNNKRLIKKILPFFDSYESAFQVNESLKSPEVEQVLAGFRITLARFQRDFFQEEKVEEIKVVSQKNLSDYKTDEIKIELSEENDDYPEGTILQVSRKGYRYQGKVLRPAEVIVNKKKS